MIVHSRALPPTRDEHRAIVTARWRYALRILDTVLAGLALPAVVLGLWLLQSLEYGWAVTLLCLAGLAAARTVWRLMDPPAVHMPEDQP